MVSQIEVWTDGQTTYISPLYTLPHQQKDRFIAIELAHGGRKATRKKFQVQVGLNLNI